MRWVVRLFRIQAGCRQSRQVIDLRRHDVRHDRGIKGVVATARAAAAVDHLSQGDAADLGNRAVTVKGHRFNQGRQFGRRPARGRRDDD